MALEAVILLVCIILSSHDFRQALETALVPEICEDLFSPLLGGSCSESTNVSPAIHINQDPIQTSNSQQPDQTRMTMQKDTPYSMDRDRQPMQIGRKTDRPPPARHTQTERISYFLRHEDPASFRSKWGANNPRRPLAHHRRIIALSQCGPGPQAEPPGRNGDLAGGGRGPCGRAAG